MGSVQGAIALAPSRVVRRGRGTGNVASCTGYAARVSARIAVPTPIFVRRAFQDAQRREDLPLRTAVVAAARCLNVGERGSAVAAAVGRLTGRADLDRLSYLAFLELFGVGDRGVLVLHRRWCPKCWTEDGEEPYERKVWWLALVDLRHLHGRLLESRCPTCGRRQPTLPRAVRIHVYSFRGNHLHSSEAVSLTGPTVERMLWYAREGTRLVHAGEAIALTATDESESLKLAYRRLADLAYKRDLHAVERLFPDEIHRAVGSKVESLMSALWRLPGECPRVVLARCACHGGELLTCSRNGDCAQ